MNKRTITWILLIIFLIQAIQLIIWIKKDDAPPAWDQSWYAMVSLNIYNQLFNKTDMSTRRLSRHIPYSDTLIVIIPPFITFPQSRFTCSSE